MSVALRLAYADPPYPGQAAKHYIGHPDYAGEVDHAVLIEQLANYDGWALSTSSAALQDVLSLCPKGIRVGAWTKPFCSFKPNVNPAYAWEPVIFSPARRRGRDRVTVRDFHSEAITLKKGLAGAKPPGFCVWIFDLLQAEPDDDFTDMFPGTGAVAEAWKRYAAIRGGRAVQGAML